MESNIAQLEANKDVLKSMLLPVDSEMITWRPAPDKWCLLEIVCHLYDEELLDFRFRTKWVLERPNEIPPPFNQLEWVEDHEYMKQNYHEMVNALLLERETSIKWLKQLKEPNWDSSFKHPKLGNLTAGYYLANWLAHDHLHMRQILKLKFNYLEHTSNMSLDYAGKW